MSHIDSTSSGLVSCVSPSICPFFVCVCVCVCLSNTKNKYHSTAWRTSVTARATSVHDCTHTHTHTHTRIMRLLRLSLNIRQAPVWFCGKLGGSCLDILIEGKSHYRLAVGKKNMINAKTGQWMIVTRIRYIRMLTDYVPAGPRRREVLLESPSPSTDTLTTATWKEQSNRPWLKVSPERRIKLHLYMFCMYVCVCVSVCTWVGETEAALLNDVIFSLRCPSGWNRDVSVTSGTSFEKKARQENADRGSPQKRCCNASAPCISSSRRGMSHGSTIPYIASSPIVGWHRCDHWHKVAIL